ncbi:MAG: DUF5343 domain-containing protein [Acidobacteria bacterium]|nr:DUF5343 domain-containing protein [Acidobacteriota bacterium]
MAALPYVTATGNIDRALLAIGSAATPPTVSQDFVKTILKIPGGSGNQMTSFLRKIGFVNSDGTPTNIYTRFRNSTTSGKAAAEALKAGYAPLYVRNEYMHQLSDQQLRGLIIEETGLSDDSAAVGMILASIKAIKKYASWSENDEPGQRKEEQVSLAPPLIEKHAPGEKLRRSDKVGLNLSYTINLNLPATSDSAVFNAIFKSLRENLLKDHDE